MTFDISPLTAPEMSLPPGLTLLKCVRGVLCELALTVLSSRAPPKKAFEVRRISGDNEESPEFANFFEVFPQGGNHFLVSLLIVPKTPGKYGVFFNHRGMVSEGPTFEIDFLSKQETSHRRKGDASSLPSLLSSRERRTLPWGNIPHILAADRYSSPRLHSPS